MSLPAVPSTSKIVVSDRKSLTGQKAMQAVRVEAYSTHVGIVDTARSQALPQ